MLESSARIDYYGRDEALLLRKPMLETYLASHRDQQHNPWYSPDQFWQRLVDLYAPSPDFGLVAAWLGETMIGYAFGSPTKNSADVWKMVRQSLPEMRVPQEATPIYFFREFAVHPEYQGKGYGRKIHDALLKTRPEPLAHLLVRTDNPAKASYLHWGWRVVGNVQPFEDAPTMNAMIRVLPLNLCLERLQQDFERVCRRNGRMVVDRPETILSLLPSGGPTPLLGLHITTGGKCRQCRLLGYPRTRSSAHESSALSRGSLPSDHSGRW